MSFNDTMEPAPPEVRLQRRKARLRNEKRKNP